MNRRDFLQISSLLSLGVLPAASHAADSDSDSQAPVAPLPFAHQRSGLVITDVRAVDPKPKRPLPAYEPSPGSWSTGGVEVANPMSIYPQYKPRRSLFMADDLGPSAVQITTDKGITGIGFGGPGTGFVVEKHLRKLLIGADPFDIERLWDILWRSTLYYGRKGLVVHAISAVDLALWDVVGNVAADADLPTAGWGDQASAFPPTAPETTSSSTSSSASSA